MNVTKVVIASAILAIASGCAPHRIPGTDIIDSRDTREILRVMELYRSAVEARDPDGVLKLISKDFHDEGGNSDPKDDLDYASLQKTLPMRLAELADVKLQIDPRQVVVEKDRGAVTYYYTLNYKLPKLTSEPQMDSEIKQMLFERQDGDWKIVSGI